MGFLELMIIAIIWMIARGFSRTLKGGMPNLSRAISVFKEQMEKQAQGTKRPTPPPPPEKKTEQEKQLDQLVMSTTNADKPEWDNWKKQDEDWHVINVDERFSPPKWESNKPDDGQAERMRRSAPEPAYGQQVAPPPISDNPWVQAVVFSEILDAPKGRRKRH